MSGFLRVDDVYKSYGEKCVLDNIDLAVDAGEFCTVVGPSGCGKSTLLRQVLGAEFPSAGSISIEGRRVGHPDPRRGIVFQRYSLFPHLTVLENVALGPRLQAGFVQGWKQRAQFREEAMEYLRRVRLGDHAHKYPHELSGGMQQRVAIAQSMVMRPHILLMDEPFGALDPDTREEMQLFLLEQWEATKMTVFFVTHDLPEALFLGTRVLVLSQYYTDDRGDGLDINRGAKIVADYQLPRAAVATGVKHSDEFTDLIERIRELGFNPAFRQHAREFNLHHPDSYQTLTVEEHSGA